MKAIEKLLWIQGCYILFTGIWPLVDIQSFLFVTGPKTDLWLVKTVGALLIPVGACLIVMAISKETAITALILGAGNALAFIIIDFYYSTRNIISDVYQIDGVIQLIFFLTWVLMGLFYVRSKSYRQVIKGIIKRRKL
jgi:hypothetical protein